MDMVYVFVVFVLVVFVADEIFYIVYIILIGC